MSPLPRILLLLLVFSSRILLDVSAEHGPPLPKFVCTPMPVDSDSGCSGNGRHSQPMTPGSSNAWWGLTDDAKATILHLRETIVQQKETILDQRETIRELTAKLTLCEGFGTHSTGHHDEDDDDDEDSDSHHSNALGHSSHPHHLPEPHPLHGVPQPLHKETHGAKNTMGDPPKHAVSVDQMGRMLQSLKERIDNLQHSRNTSTSSSNSLRDLLQRRIAALEQQIQHRLHSGGEEEEEEEEEGGDHHHHSEDEDDDHHNQHENDTAHGHHDDGHHDDGHHSNGHHDNGHHDNGHHDNGHHDDSHHDEGHHHDDGHHDNGHRGNHVPHHRRGVKSRDNHGRASHGHKLDTVMSHLPHRNSDKGTSSHAADYGCDFLL
ncbi:UNVERIFIED_CONTAM: hypothetical protein FKN15_019559 [Acipenser sinensis]